jgi:hypothetical protein
MPPIIEAAILCSTKSHFIPAAQNQFAKASQKRLAIVRTFSATKVGASQRTTRRLNLRTSLLPRSACATKTPANLPQAPGYDVERGSRMRSNLLIRPREIGAAEGLAL